MNANEPYHPIVGEGVKTSYGITNYEHMVIEFAKAMITSHPSQTHNYKEGVECAILWANEVVKQLNETK